MLESATCFILGNINEGIDWVLYKEVLLDLISVDVEQRDSKEKGKGFVIREEYICPCGKSTIPYITYNFPNYKEGYSYDVCQDCYRDYSLNLRGVAMDFRD